MITSVLSVFVPAATIGRQVAIAIISGLGGSVAGGAIGIAFSEDVAVNAKYYTLTGYHAKTNRYSSGYDGVARQVYTKKVVIIINGFMMDLHHTIGKMEMI